jgi:hypothetical protein
MIKMGFVEGWVKLVMKCVSTVMYSIIINGEPMGLIKHGVLGKGILSALTFSFFVRRSSAIISKWRLKMEPLKVSLHHRKGQNLTTYFLQMIVCCFAGLLFKSRTG